MNAILNPLDTRSTTADTVTPAPGPDTLGRVHSVETCGTVDGPGTRYIVFTSGCPLRCQYCHNPDTQGKACGGEKTAASVVEDVLRYKNFIRRGGLTISGGEPLMQPDFVHAIFKGAKDAGIHTALDTSGFLGARASDALLESVDLVLLDLKSWLPETYRKVTGVGIEPTLAFARRLEAMGKPVWMRFVLVPGLTDAKANLEGVAKFIASLSNVERTEILPFHKMGESKYKALGMPYNLTDIPTPTAAQLAEAHAIFAAQGVEVA